MKFIPLIILLLTVQISCEKKGIDWTTAKNRNSIHSYREFIFFSQDEEKIFAAKLKLEKLLFNRLLSSKGVAAVVTFLHEFPNGKYKKEAKRLLALRRFKAAVETKRVWPLIRYLHYHNKSASTSKVKSILEKRWWKKIKQKPTSKQIRLFLGFFPNSFFIKPVREILAELEYKSMGKNPDPEKVRQFAIAFSETKYGEIAKQDFTRIRNIEIMIAGSFKSLLRIIGKKATLPKKFLAVSLKRHFAEAVYNLDHIKLEQVCSLSPLLKCEKWQLSTIKSWKKLKGSKRKSFKAIVSKARPWKPFPSVKSLAIALESDDLRTVWIALDSLVWVDSPLAFFLIISKVGISRWEISWMAERALARWYQRKLIWADTVVQYELSRIKGKTGDLKYLIRAHMLSKILKLKTNYLSKLMKIKPKKEYELQLKILHAQNGKPQSWGSVTLALNIKLSRLKTMFPKTVTEGNFLLSRRISRRIFALKTKMMTLNPSVKEVARMKTLTEQASILESQWDKLLRKFKNYESSKNNPIENNIITWNMERILIHKKLKSLKGIRGKFWIKFFNFEISKNQDSN